jgi:hypothetical protein
MGRYVAFVALALAAARVQGHAAPLYDAVALNIGVNCQWQKACQQRQRNAMNEAHRFIAAANPPVWRIHLCNRNAARGTARIDWVGFNDCVRNPNLHRPRRIR